MIFYNLHGLLLAVVSAMVGAIVGVTWSGELGMAAFVATAALGGCVCLAASKKYQFPLLALPLFLWGPVFAIAAPIFKLIWKEPVIGSPTCFYLLLVAVGNVLMLGGMLAFSMLTHKKKPAEDEEGDDEPEDEAGPSDDPRRESPAGEKD